MDLQRKVCVITGATSGIGYYTARTLAIEGADLILVCRNPAKAEQAKAALLSVAKHPTVRTVIADLGIQAEVRRAAADIAGMARHIDVLVNNAGAIQQDYALTPDGIETTFAVNHLAYFMLTGLLKDNLLAAERPRVINLASQAQSGGSIQLDNINLTGAFTPFKAYAQSKLANILFTYAAARRLAPKAAVNAVHPGVVRTGFGRNMQGAVQAAVTWFGWAMRKPEKGAETVLWLATLPRESVFTGKYFKDAKEIKSRPESYNTVLQEQLWELSARLTGCNW